MSEEEIKEKIELLKELLEYGLEYKDYIQVVNAFEDIEKLIKEQQKTIENSVSKDKIRETIDRYSMNLEFDYRPMEVIETKEINKLLEE